MAAKRWLLIGSCVLIAILGIPLVLRMVPPNGFYGFRTPATRSTPDIWYPANVFAGWALVIAAAISAIVLFMLPPTTDPSSAAIIVVPLLGALVACFVYLRRLG